MTTESTLYTLDEALFHQVPRGLPLVIVLTGFADAGGAVSQLEDYMWDEASPREFVTFDSDMLHDYRARRPTIVFEEDHLAEYDPPSISLSIATDDVGRQFLLLMGPEPDFRWNHFANSVMSLATDLAVGPITWVHSIPMPIPHSRPVGVTVSGSRQDIIEARSVWRPTTQVPATVGHLLEYRFQLNSNDVTGFVLLVSHYLSDTEFPAALLAALECISEATGLIFATDSVRERGREFIAKIDEQVAANEESRAMVRALEERHDSYMEDQNLRSPLMTDEGSIPTADQIASELEQFLATRTESKRKQDGSPGNGASPSSSDQNGTPEL